VCAHTPLAPWQATHAQESTHARTHMHMHTHTHLHTLSHTRHSHTLKQMSFALSLMLVFRTNSSYARWVEARALWAVLINSGRNLVRGAVVCARVDGLCGAAPLGYLLSGLLAQPATSGARACACDRMLAPLILMLPPHPPPGPHGIGRHS